MKLSNRGRYGIFALFDLGYHADGRAMQVKDIAARQGIPPRFLEQIFQDLKRAGLVTSKRGPNGGYRLTRPIDEIRLGDILRAVEGPVTIGVSSRSTSSRRRDDDELGKRSRRVIEETFDDLSRNIEACFDRVTVADLCARGEDLGVARSARPKSAYVI